MPTCAVLVQVSDVPFSVVKAGISRAYIFDRSVMFLDLANDCLSMVLIVHEIQHKTETDCKQRYEKINNFTPSA